MKYLVIVSIALLFSEAPLRRRDGGIFPLMDVATRKQVLGTAFLIDKANGYFLTAAHVVWDCGVDDVGKEVPLRWSLPDRDGSGRHTFEQDILLKVAEAGYDLKSGHGKGSGTSGDWVLLKVAQEKDLPFFEPYEEYPIDETLTFKKIKEWAKNNQSAEIIGFGQGEMVKRSQPGHLNDSVSEEGLLRVYSRVKGGNSGGTCITQNGCSTLLLGVMISRNGDDPDFACFIPSYLIAKGIAQSNRVQHSEHVRNAIQRLQDIVRVMGGSWSKDTASQKNVADAIFQFVLLLHRLSGLECYQLASYLCTKPVERAMATEVILRYFDETPGAPLIASMNCNPLNIGDTAGKVSTFIEENTLEKNLEGQSKGARYLEAIGELVFDNYAQVRAISKKDVLDEFLLKYAFAFRASPDRQKALWALAQVGESSSENTNWQNTAGFVMNDLPSFKRMTLLTSGYENRVRISESGQVTFTLPKDKSAADAFASVALKSTKSAELETVADGQVIKLAGSDWSNLTSSDAVRSATQDVRKSLEKAGYRFGTK